MKKQRWIFVLLAIAAAFAVWLTADAQSSWVGPTKDYPPTAGYELVKSGTSWSQTFGAGEYIAASFDCDGKWLASQNRTELTHRFDLGAGWEDTPCYHQMAGDPEPPDGQWQWKVFSLQRETTILFERREDSGTGYLWFKPTPPTITELTLNAACPTPGVDSNDLTVTGVVKDQHGQPMVDVVVTVDLPDGSHPTVKTNSNGQYSYAFIGAKQYIGQSITVHAGNLSQTLGITEQQFEECVTPPTPWSGKLFLAMITEAPLPPPPALVQFRSCGDPYWAQVPVGELSAYSGNCGGEHYPRLLDEHGYVVIHGFTFATNGWSMYPNINRPQEAGHESHVWLLMTNGADDILISNLGIDAALGYPGPIKVYLNGNEESLQRDTEVPVADWGITEFVFEARGLRWQALKITQGDDIVWTVQETQGSLRTGWIEVQTEDNPENSGLWADAVRLGEMPENLEDYIVSLELNPAAVRAAVAAQAAGVAEPMPVGKPPTYPLLLPAISR